jgi:hypothetical protein
MLVFAWLVYVLIATMPKLRDATPGCFIAGKHRRKKDGDK